MSRVHLPPPPYLSRTGSPEHWAAGWWEQLCGFVDEHREVLAACLDGMDDDRARRRLVPSETTLLGLVKHAAFVEQMWFGVPPDGQPISYAGQAVSTPTESFRLDDDDTVASVRAAHAAVVAHAREVAATADPDADLSGNREGTVPLRWIMMHLLREMAHHAGHADILREQILAAAETED